MVLGTADQLAPRATAAVIAGVDRALHAEIRRRISLGEPADTVRTEIRNAAERTFPTLSAALDP
ncbi:hypothetical protein [Actinoplanes sp. G11-F43]|uniref:hypothetical protein n=1 Tax=Actinoplanes sp. G11-F43 TaxID=3424130 RepID=UPI003D359A4A